MKTANKIIKINASARVKPFLCPVKIESLSITKNAPVTTTSIGSSRFTVRSFTAIGFTIVATPTISKMFTMQDPITFANVISTLWLAIEVNEIASSGAQVPNAAIVKAINIFGTRILVANDEAASTKTSDALTSAIRPTTSKIIYSASILS